MSKDECECNNKECWGRCCEFVYAPIPPQEDYTYWALHGCKIDKENELMLIPCPCSMLLADGSCYIYNDRPRLCKIFPHGTPPSVLRALKCTMKVDEK